jgi:hypothetical protein
MIGDASSIAVTANRQWAYARAWLRCELGGEGNAPAW